ncbi:hypothetical protein D3C71_1855680 [compost metagenome]
MSKQEVDLLNAYMNNGEDVGGHVGMKNAFMRLKLYYGNAIDVQISSEEGAGTIVRISTPVQASGMDRPPMLY